MKNCAQQCRGLGARGSIKYWRAQRGLEATKELIMATLLPTSLYHSNAALCALLRPATSDEKSPVEVEERECAQRKWASEHQTRICGRWSIKTSNYVLERAKFPLAQECFSFFVALSAFKLGLTWGSNMKKLDIKLSFFLRNFKYTNNSLNLRFYFILFIFLILIIFIIWSKSVRHKSFILSRSIAAGNCEFTSSFPFLHEDNLAGICRIWALRGTRSIYYIGACLMHGCALKSKFN